jgi:K+-sensing histidine kinase KdpD
MLLKNAKDWNDSSFLVRYCGAVILTGLALAIRMLIHPYIEPYLPFQLFFLSTFISSLIWGIGPGILSLLLGLFSGFYFFTRPYDSFATPSVSDIWVMITYASTSLVMQGLTEYTRRVMYSSELLLKVADSNYRLSLFSENEKIDISRKLRANQKTVDDLITSLDENIFLLSGDQKSQFLRQAHLHFDKSTLERFGNNWTELFLKEDLPLILHAKDASQELGNLASPFEFRFSFEDNSKPRRSGIFKQVNIASNPLLICSLKN